MYNHIDKQGKTLMTASEKMQVITRTESYVVADNLACHRADIHFKKRYGSFMWTQIVKKRQNKALISGLCQYIKHRRKNWEIEKRLLQADRSFIRSSYKWTRLYIPFLQHIPFFNIYSRLFQIIFLAIIYHYLCLYLWHLYEKFITAMF